MGYKPNGYTDVSAYLLVRDLHAAIRFAQTVFDAEALRVMNRPDGAPMHGEIRIGDSIVMLGQTDRGPESGAHVHVYVPDAAKCYAKGLAAGAKPVQEPQDQGDGDLRAGFLDPCGTTWWPSTRQYEP